MKILITGVSGLLGGNLAVAYHARHHVVGVDLIKSNLPNTVFIPCNLMEKGHFEKILDQEKPSVVIHCMAMVNVDACEVNPNEAYAANTEVTAHIAQCCAVRAIKMLYISTDAVFDGEAEGLYRENDFVNPVNVYAESKLAGEKAVLNASAGHLVLRTNIYGFNIAEKQSFGEWVIYSLQEGKTLTMFTDVLFSPILVNELASVIEQSLVQNLTGLYHACGSGCISKYELGCALQRTFDISSGKIVPTTVESFSFQAKRSKNMSMSNEKICDALDMKISTPIESISKFKTLYDTGVAKQLKNYRG